MIEVDSNHCPARAGRSPIYQAWLAVAVIAAILGAGIAVVDDYGIASDEIHGIDVLSRNYELIVNDVPIDSVYRFDGTIFNFASEGVYQLYKRAAVDATRRAELEQDMLAAFHARIQVKHAVTFLASLIAYASVAIMVGVLCGWRYAWVGPVVLVLMPRFFGHSFFNFKDIPFAAVFTLCSLQAAFLVNRAAFDPPAEIGRTDRGLLWGFAIYGLLVALLTGIRFGGFIHLAFPVVAYVMVVLLSGKTGGVSAPRLAFGYMLSLACWFAGAVLMYPYLWADPLQGVFDMVTAMSDYPWKGRVLFDGEFIRAYNLPAVYLPVWAALSTPVLTLVAAVAGFVWLLVRWTSLGSLARVLVVFVFLQAFLLPLTTIVGNATYYDGLRHFLFTLPAIAAAASTCLVWLCTAPARRVVRIACACVLGIAYIPVVMDLRELHPYEYTYFNRAFGGLEAADGRFETDYWGLSLREGGEWLAANAGPGAGVVVGGPLHSVRPFTGRKLELIPLDDVKNGKATDLTAPFYYIARPRWELHREFEHCERVFDVTRQNTSLTIVKKCDGSQG